MIQDPTRLTPPSVPSVHQVYGYSNDDHSSSRNPSRGEMGYEDMGYEDHTAPAPAPQQRRGSMTPAEEKERRASIKAILADGNMDQMEKRRSIQHLMDGRRNSLTATSSHSNGTGSVDMGYGDMDSGGVKKSSFSSSETICKPVTNSETRRMERSRPPCVHYDRMCTIIAPCCGAPFGCRICHDDCPVLPPQIDEEQRDRMRKDRSSSLPSSFTCITAQPEDTQHTIDRFKIRAIICRECFTMQSSKT